MHVSDPNSNSCTNAWGELITEIKIRRTEQKIVACISCVFEIF